MRYFRRYAVFAGLACLLSLGAAAASPSRVPAGWLTHKNPILGYSISYPRGWRVDPAYVYPGFGPDHEIRGVGFQIPKALAKGTNLSISLTGTSVESVPPGKRCDARRFLADAQNVRTVRQDGRVWSVADGSDAGAGNFYEISVFVLATRTQCLAVRTLIHSTNIANYDPGTVKPFDREALIATFDRIRRSLKLPGEK